VIFRHRPCGEDDIALFLAPPLLCVQLVIIFFYSSLLEAKGVKKMKKENNNRMLVDRKWMVNMEVFDEIEKLDCDGVVRVYKKCKSIEEGLLG